LSQLIQITAATNSRVEELTEDVHQIKESIAAMTETQRTMLQIQQEQQKILDRLSVRSIAHEADIAELRRIK